MLSTLLLFTLFIPFLIPVYIFSLSQTFTRSPDSGFAYSDLWLFITDQILGEDHRHLEEPKFSFTRSSFFGIFCLFFIPLLSWFYVLDSCLSQFLFICHHCVRLFICHIAVILIYRSRFLKLVQVTLGLAYVREYFSTVHTSSTFVATPFPRILGSGAWQEALVLLFLELLAAWAKHGKKFPMCACAHVRERSIYTIFVSSNLCSNRYRREIFITFVSSNYFVFE